jgi:hypothetical protein
MQDTGKVAGVFTVVGIVATSLFIGFFFLCCRQLKRRTKQQSELPDLPREKYHDNPFRDPLQPTGSPGMGSTYQPPLHWNQQIAGPEPLVSGPKGPDQTSSEPDKVAHAEHSRADIQDPFCQYEVGLAITTTDEIRSTQSSPSLYPPSVDERDTFEPIPLIRSTLPVPGLESGPPRPPRSHLRDSANRQPVRTVYPLTPSPTFSSHSRSTSESMSGVMPAMNTSAVKSEDVRRVASHEEILSRQTLLGVCDLSHRNFPPPY